LEFNSQWDQEEPGLYEYVFEHGAIRRGSSENWSDRKLISVLPQYHFRRAFLFTTAPQNTEEPRFSDLLRHQF